MADSSPQTCVLCHLCCLEKEVLCRRRWIKWLFILSVTKGQKKRKRKKEKEEKEKKGSCAGLTLVCLTGLTQHSLSVDERTVVSDLYTSRRKKESKERK